jgi:hypothetical protein
VEHIIRLGCADAPPQNDAGKPYHPNNQTLFTKKIADKAKMRDGKKSIKVWLGKCKFKQARYWTGWYHATRVVQLAVSKFAA